MRTSRTLSSALWTLFVIGPAVGASAEPPRAPPPPGFTTGQTPDFTTGQTPGATTGQTPDFTTGPTPGPTTGPLPGPTTGQTPEFTTGPLGDVPEGPLYSPPGNVLDERTRDAPTDAPLVPNPDEAVLESGGLYVEDDD